MLRRLLFSHFRTIISQLEGELTNSKKIGIEERAECTKLLEQLNNLRSSHVAELEDLRNKNSEKVRDLENTFKREVLEQRVRMIDD